MIPFRLFYERALGLIEVVSFKELGPVDAKVDSGNGAFNVLHGTDLQEYGDTVNFKTINNKGITKKIHDFININIGAGKVEKRPVVLFDIEFAGKQWKNIPFSISDRSTNEQPVLIGKDFIVKNGGVIDVTKTYNVGEGTQFFFENAKLLVKRFQSTTTVDKLQVIARENEFINQFVPSRGANDQVVGVVGEAKTGFLRHLNQYQQLGFDTKNVFIFEILDKEFQNLVTYNKRYGGLATIIRGNIFEPDRYKLINKFNKLKVTHVDADITSGLSQDFADEIKNTFEVYPNAKSAVFVHSQRNAGTHRGEEILELYQDPLIQKLMDLVKLRRNNAFKYVASFKNVLEVMLMGETMRNKTLNDLKDQFPNDSILIQSYKGKGPMISLTIVKNTPSPTFISNVKSLNNDDISNFKQVHDIVMRWPNYDAFYLNTAVFNTPKIVFSQEEYNKLRKILKQMNSVIT